MDLTLVPLLPVFTPETVKHHLGQGTSPGVLVNLVCFEGDPFLGSVLVDVLLTFVDIVPHPLGPAAGFLLNLEKRVHVRGEHGVGTAREMPDFVHAYPRSMASCTSGVGHVSTRHRSASLCLQR